MAAAAAAIWQGPSHHPTRHVLSVLLAAALIGAGCATSPTVISATAQPVVDRLLVASPPERWTITYQPDAPSPYLACLGGIDEVYGAIDLSGNVLRLEPNRDAPPVIVTDTSLLLPDPSEPGTWLKIAWTPTLDTARLQLIFGEVLAGYIATGLRAPDLNMTTEALIDIASSVETADPPVQLTGDVIGITVDPRRYLRELEANDVAAIADERDHVPTFAAVVDAIGRVSALVVDTDPARADDGEGGHGGNRYIVTAHYDMLAQLEAPPAEVRTPATLADVSYPTPDASCEFGS